MISKINKNKLLKINSKMMTVFKKIIVVIIITNKNRKIEIKI